MATRWYWHGTQHTARARALAVPCAAGLTQRTCVATARQRGQGGTPGCLAPPLWSAPSFSPCALLLFMAALLLFVAAMMLFMAANDAFMRGIAAVCRGNALVSRCSWRQPFFKKKLVCFLARMWLCSVPVLLFSVTMHPFPETLLPFLVTMLLFSAAGGREGHRAWKVHGAMCEEQVECPALRNQMGENAAYGARICCAGTFCTETGC